MPSLSRALPAIAPRRVAALIVISALLGAGLTPLQAIATRSATDVGYEDGSYSGSAPTGREPMSKLWFNDGLWWASLYNSTSGAVDIHRLDWASQTWVDTGVRIDERSASSADTLWDGSKLYILSSYSDQSLSCSPSTSGDRSLRMLRYSYNSVGKTYSLDSGFPVTVATGGVEAAALDKDSLGTIWITWGYPSGGHGNVWLSHSTTDTATYVAPYVLPLPGATTMDCSDYSAIVSYNGRIGIMWSNQPESSMYFGIHVDGDPDTTWTRSTALSGSGWADNHVNVKALQADASGQVFAATKTSLNGDQCPPSSGNSSQPLIVLAIMDGSGGWQRRTVSTAQYCWTRPLVVIDQQDRQVYVFGTQPPPGASYGSGGTIMYKSAGLDNPNFPDGAGAPFIQLAADTAINNASSTKQTVGSASGLVVLAADDHTHHYVHNAISLGGSDTTPPTVVATSPVNGASAVSPSISVTAGFSEQVSPGTVSASTFTLTDATTSTGVPASVSYDSGTATAILTPSAPLTGGDTFTARVLGGPSGVTDLAGNPLAADVTWSFTTGVPVALFTDGFETGNLGAWSPVQTGGDGTATVQSGLVKTGSYAARFTATTNSGSKAYARKSLSANQSELWLDGDFQVTSDGTQSGKSIPFFKVYTSGGSQILNLYRQDVTGRVYVTYGGTTYQTSGVVSRNQWVHVQAHLAAGSGTGTVEVRVDNAPVYQRTTATLSAMRTLQIGNDSSKQPMTLYVDNVVASALGSGPSAPDTTITSGPTGTVSSTSATFSFTSTQPGSTFACSLDGAPATTCTSSASYTNLADGGHTFSVAATANGLTDPTPATRAWTVDTQPPSVTSESPTDGAVSVSTSSSVAAGFNEPMAAGSITGSTFTLTDTTAGSPVTGTVGYNSQNQAATFAPSQALAAGHDFTARVVGGIGGVTDVAGNPLAADVTWGFTTATAVDLTPPTVTLTAPGQGATVSGTTVSFSATAGDDVAVDRVEFLVGAVVVGTDTTAPYSYTWDSTTVPDGTTTVTARAVDTSGNPASDVHTITVNNGGGPLFSDDFESNSLFKWSVLTGGDGSATVQSAVVKSGSYSARLSESSTSGSKAYARAVLTADQSELTVTGDFQVFAEGTSSQNVPIIRLFNASGTRLVSLYRQSASGNKIYVGYGGTNYLTSALLPLNTWGTFQLHVIAGSGTATVQVRVNGTLVYSSTAATVAAVRTVQIGNETAAQPMGIYVDNVVVTSP